MFFLNNLGSYSDMPLVSIPKSLNLFLIPIFIIYSVMFLLISFISNKSQQNMATMPFVFKYEDLRRNYADLLKS